MLLIIVVAVSTHLLFAEGNKKNECPPIELMPSCSCDLLPSRILIEEHFVRLICGEVVNNWDFLNILHHLEDYNIYQMEFHNLSIHFLPKGFLKYHPVDSLVFRNSLILGMESEDGEAMFEGATGSIRLFGLHKVEGANAWSWTALSVLRDLTILAVSSCDLTQIGPEFEALPTAITFMDFSDNKISHISHDAISRQHHLEVLALSGNEISEIKRWMFPDPARKLFTLGLSHNKIKELPDGIFRNMPSLRRLDLSSNNIKWLTLSALEPIPQMADIHLKDNNIHCCGAQEWIVRTRFQKMIDGTCSVPTELVGKEIKSLTSTDFNHGIC